MTETLTHGYLSESTQRELSNEYQHGRAYKWFLKIFSFFFHPCASALEVISILIIFLEFIFLEKAAFSIGQKTRRSLLSYVSM